MHKRYRIISIVLVLYLIFSIDSIHSQQSHNCQYQISCYDPKLSYSPGDVFDWETNGYRLKNDYYDRTAGLFPIRIIKNVQMQILKVPNGEPSNTFLYGLYGYFKFIVNYEYEHNGTERIEEDQSISRLLQVPFISPTMIYYGESDFQNQFEILASNFPERTQIFLETDNILEGRIEGTITITNRVENDIYVETKQITRALQPEDSSLDGVLISTENIVTRIDASTGLLLEYNFEMIDANGKVVDSSSIKLEGNHVDEILDLGVFENSVVFLVILITIFSLITIYYKIGR